MTEVADWKAALARYLKEALLFPGLEGRVWRPDLALAEEANMPRPNVVITSAGGGHMFGADRLPAFDHLADISCWGSTRQEAEELGEEVEFRLRELSHTTREGVLLHWARIAGGVKSAIDKKTEWPFAIVTTQVMHSIP